MQTDFGFLLCRWIINILADTISLTILDVVAMTDMRAKRLTEPNEQAGRLARSRRKTEHDMAITKWCYLQEGRGQIASCLGLSSLTFEHLPKRGLVQLSFRVQLKASGLSLSFTDCQIPTGFAYMIFTK